MRRTTSSSTSGRQRKQLVAKRRPSFVDNDVVDITDTMQIWPKEVITTTVDITVDVMEMTMRRAASRMRAAERKPERSGGDAGKSEGGRNREGALAAAKVRTYEYASAHNDLRGRRCVGRSKPEYGGKANLIISYRNIKSLHKKQDLNLSLVNSIGFNLNLDLSKLVYVIYV